MSDDNSRDAGLPDPVISVGSSNVDLGSAFRSSAEAAIRKSVAKHMGRLTAASVHVAAEGSSYRCSLTIQVGGTPTLAAEGDGPDVPAAFRAALEKVDKQLRRTKRALREDRHNRPDRRTTA
jgi:ribosomal subunit interface protein